MRRFALFVVIVFAILLGLLLAWRLSEIVLMFVASLAVAATLRAPLEWLVARRVPQGLAIMLLYVMLGLAILALLVLLYGQLGRELANLSEELNYLYARVRTQFSVLGQLGPGFVGRFPTPEQMTQLLTDNQVGNLEQIVIGTGGTLANTLGNVLLVIILSIYWTADHLRFERLALALLPVKQRAVARTIWRTVEARVGRYLRSEVLQSLLVGLLLAPIFALLGLHWPVFGALLASLAWLVPLVGGLIVLIPMTMIVWFQSGPLIAVLAVLAVVLVLILMEFGVERRLYVRERGANVLTIMVVLVMTDAFGLIGLLLAPPVAETIDVLLNELANSNSVQPAAPTVDASVADLEKQLDDVRRLIAATTGEGGDRRLENLADRLETLLAETRRVVA